MVSVMLPNSNGKSALHFPPTPVMLQSSMATKRLALIEWQQTRAFKRRCGSSTNHAHPETPPTEPAALDVTMAYAEPCALNDVLVRYDLSLRWWMSLMPEHFLGQALRPSVAGIYVYPSSAPLHAAHRRVGTKTQSRVEIRPGECLLRGPVSRRVWTLALTPLLSTTDMGRTLRPEDALEQTVEAVEHAAIHWSFPTCCSPGDPGRMRLWSQRVRKFAILVDRGFDIVSDDEVFDFEVHRPRDSGI